MNAPPMIDSSEVTESYHRFALRFETRAVMGKMSNPKRVTASWSKLS